MKVTSGFDLISARAPSGGLEEEVSAVDSSGFHHKFVNKSHVEIQPSDERDSRATSGTWRVAQ
jgi:hypothetical protein